MELCLGTVQLGMQYGIQNNMRPNISEAMGILSDALALRIHWFDTASAYGESENILGQFSMRFPAQAQSMQIVSKLGSDALQDVPRKEWRRIAEESARERLKKLKREKLDAFLFHNSAYIFDDEAVDALNHVRAIGLAKSIGVSIYTPEEAMQALKYSQISSIQIPYNVFDHRLDQCGFFARAAASNVRIYARSSLLQGLAVIPQGELPRHMQFAAPYLNQFHLICRDFDITPLQAAIGYVMGNPNIDQVVFGVDSRAQLAEYVRLQQNPIPEELKNALTDAFADVEEKLVDPSRWRR